MSAAGRAAALGMSHVLLEKTDHISDTIFKYQKGKHVMATPSNLVLRSDMLFDAGKRETILGIWNKHCGIADDRIPPCEDDLPTYEINVKLDAEVAKVEGAKGDFTITLKNGEVVRAETIVLAIGTQGNPNMLRCPGSDHEMIQYQLDDPGEYFDEHITVVGSGDAGIENALGLAADDAQRNVVTILNRRDSFARAKAANVALLEEAERDGRISVRRETSPKEVRDGEMVLETRDGEETIRCDRIIARTGSQPPRGFVEAMGIAFTSEERGAFPKLSPAFETTVPGIHVIGALAGYPLIKHCMNQGYDVIEFLNGNTDLKPADEPILSEKFAVLPGDHPVDHWLDVFGGNVAIFAGLSPLQLRELMLDSTVHYYEPGDVIFRRNEPGSSMFAIAQGSVAVEINPNDPSVTVPIEQGSIFGEVGLISGRRRGSTIRAADQVVAIELSRNAALKLIATSPEAADAVNRIAIERQLLQMFGSGLTPQDIAPLVEAAEIMELRAGQVLIEEGADDQEVYIIRRGSMIVEKDIGGRPVFLSYLPAGSYVGEMAAIDGSSRTATVKAAVKSEAIRLPGDRFAKLLDRNPALREKALAEMEGRRKTNAFIESRKDQFEDVVDLYSETAQFLVDEGLGEATDVLLIDEKLCVGCDNCERACADAHEGLSRLDREAGRTYAHLHVPTSCRHCEHPHCMADCPPNAIKRGPDGEVVIDDTCIGCGNCQRNCPYGVIRMDPKPPKKPSLFSWLLFGAGPGPGEASYSWRKEHGDPEQPKQAIKCDMCSGIKGGPACVRACPTGAAIRVSPDKFLTFTKLTEDIDS
ncbi:cyclic nucleotide-binding domain-containing protein [Qipengyuania nanhaisediminis]|uniref:cyclic nucleotide-binding domain-containing protein n=1 Tax=Qipengyuania nanhaisediminis TaxID=604088 RepID=UPI0038B2BD97